MSAVKHTNWDVDQYKTHYESKDHWELRKSFMMKYKDRFEENELVCLAQVFTNVEFLGCRYPAETMLLVSELAKEVAHDYRKSRENRLKRTFAPTADPAAKKLPKK